MCSITVRIINCRWTTSMQCHRLTLATWRFRSRINFLRSLSLTVEQHTSLRLVNSSCSTSGASSRCEREFATAATAATTKHAAAARRLSQHHVILVFYAPSPSDALTTSSDYVTTLQLRVTPISRYRLTNAELSVTGRMSPKLIWLESEWRWLKKTSCKLFVTEVCLCMAATK